MSPQTDHQETFDSKGAKLSERPIHEAPRGLGIFSDLPGMRSSEISDQHYHRSGSCTVGLLKSAGNTGSGDSKQQEQSGDGNRVTGPASILRKPTNLLDVELK